VERLFSGTSVVLFWGGLNTILAAVLAGFTASGSVGGPGPAGALAFIIYAASATLVFLIGLAVWGGRRRVRRLSEPPRAASALLLATGVAMAWTGLAVGEWAAYLAAGVVLIALVYEFYPRMRP
jgi:O-antigen/teichoic acid export membrane protein